MRRCVYIENVEDIQTLPVTKSPRCADELVVEGYALQKPSDQTTFI